MKPPRIYISSPMDDHLGQKQRKIKQGILDAIKGEGFEPQEFLVSGIPRSMSWSFDTAYEIMSRCSGAAILAFVRWSWDLPPDYKVLMPSEYNHYEGALAIAQRLPILLIAEEGVMNRGIVWMGGGLPITFIPSKATSNWPNSPEFKKRFRDWCTEIRNRKQVFVGYCSKAKSTADALIRYLNSLNVSVLDWATDFPPGGNLLDQIEEAARTCLCGIFLFTRDDPLAGSDEHHAAPRDNVVFEAGYFTRARGRERTLIIREEGAKMPADLGGNIYVPLKDRSDIFTIEKRVEDFLKASL